MIMMMIIIYFDLFSDHASTNEFWLFSCDSATCKDEDGLIPRTTQNFMTLSKKTKLDLMLNTSICSKVN